MHASRTAGPLGGRRTISALLVGAFLALGILAMLGTSATAAEEQGGNRFAAIAVDPGDNTAGWSFNYATRVAAERRALRECRVRSTAGTCRGVVWVRNGCASVAARRRSDGSLSRVAWGIGPTRSLAQRRARSRCQSDGRSCFVRAWACST